MGSAICRKVEIFSEIMGSSASKSSPTKESSTQGEVQESPSKSESQVSVGSNNSESTSSIIKDKEESVPQSTIEESPKKKEELTNTAEDVGINQNTPKIPSVNVDKEITSPETDFQVSKEALDEVLSATRELEERKGGKCLEIMLSPAVKKGPVSRLSPPSSPQGQAQNTTSETIQRRLRQAEERRLSIGDQKVASLSAQLAKVQLVQQKKEDLIQERAGKIKEDLENKLTTADENRSSYLSDMKSKVSDHMSKIEKAQRELEAQIEAARVAAEASLNEKSLKTEENKTLQMESVLAKPKEHQEYVEKVRNNQEDMLKPKVEELEAKIKAKEERSRELLAARELELREKIAEQNRKAELVRINKEKLEREGGQDLDLTNESA